MGTAVAIGRPDGWWRDAVTYRVDPPIQYEGRVTDHVVVAAGDQYAMGETTAIYPSDARGEVLCWRELGALRGMDMDLALARAGYEVRR